MIEKKGRDNLMGVPASLNPDQLNELAELVAAKLAQQNEGTCFTRRGSEVQVLYRPF